MSSLYIKNGQVVVKIGGSKAGSGFARGDYALEGFDTGIQDGDVVHYRNAHIISTESGNFAVLNPEDVVAVETND